MLDRADEGFSEKKPGPKGITGILWLFASLSGLASLLFLLGDLFIYKTGPSGSETKVFVTIWDIFSGSYFPAEWFFAAIIALLALGALLPLFRRFGEGFLVGSALSYLLGACLLLLSREFFAEASGFGDASLQYGIALAAVFAVFGGVCSIIGGYDSVPMTVQEMSEEAVLVACAFGLNFLKVPIGATGGSINLQMLPLMLIALRHGPAKGLVADGIVFGLLTCFTDGYGFFTYPFDYLIGFGGIAVMGFFGKAIFPTRQKNYSLRGEILLLVSSFLATLIRFAGSMASSMLYYSLDFSAAVAYNIVYIPVSGLSAALVLMALYGPLCRLNALHPSEYLKRNAG
jgi:thiamine transporter